MGKVKNVKKQTIKKQTIKNPKIVLLTVFIIVLLGAAGIVGAQQYQTHTMHLDAGEMYQKPITYKGKKYEYNKDLVNVLCLGVDQRGTLEDSGIVGKGGQADTIIIVSLDKKTNEMQLINLSRDSMVEVARHDADGAFYDYDVMQVCLQYAYGITHEESCDLMLERVSAVFKNLPLKGYFALNLDAIPVINDAIGGVEVTLEDDFTYFDTNMSLGTTLTLRGEQAVYYIWDRNITQIGNAERMVRQKNYINQYLKKASKEVKKDITLPLKVIEQILPCTRTNLSAVDVAELAALGLKCDVEGTKLSSVPGEVKDGGEHWEYYIDEEKLEELIVTTFFREVEG